MKSHLLLLFSSMVVGFSACKKDCSNLGTNASNVISIENAIPIKTGTIDFTSKNSSGTATIYQQKNGSYILAFEQMQFNSNTDVDVKFSATNETNTSVKLFSIKSISGHFYFGIPQSIDENSINYLFFQSDIAETPVGSTWLK